MERIWLKHYPAGVPADIGIMDEKGHTRIVDRKKDMILVSGFNVYPNEIEGVVKPSGSSRNSECWSGHCSG